MATDIRAILANLTEFYDFGGRRVIHVGAGGGQLIGYAQATRHVLAVDPDPVAIAGLRAAIDRQHLDDRVTVVVGRFEDTRDQADVVLFEFCLHEMDDPAGAVAHAQTLSPDVVVIDHSPDSTWAWYAAEDDKAARSWQAIEHAGIRREQRVVAWQHFPDVEALVTRVEILGEPATTRARSWAGDVPVAIEMRYRMALL